MSIVSGFPTVRSGGSGEDSVEETVEVAKGSEVGAQNEGAAASRPGSAAVRVLAVADVEEGWGIDSEIGERHPEDPRIGLQGAVPLGGVDAVEVMAEAERVQLGFGVEIRNHHEWTGPEAVEEVDDAWRRTGTADDRDQEAGFRLPPGGSVGGRIAARSQAAEAAQRALAERFADDARPEQAIGVEGAVNVERDRGDPRQGHPAGYSLLVNFRTICWRTSPP